MSRSRQALFVLLAAMATVPLAIPPADAATGRFRGTVVDENGDPIEGVSVTVTTAELPDFHERLETNKRGIFTLTVAQIDPVYTLQLTKPGYRSLKVDVQVRATEVAQETYTLPEVVAGEEEVPGALPVAEAEEVNVAIRAYNEGATAQRAGDLATARERLEAALAEDEDLAPAHVALATVSLDLGRHEQALAHADRGLELRPGDREALRVRYEALLGLGRRDEADAAKEALKKAEGLSTTAKSLYNEGSEAYQAQDLDTALAKFREAAEKDPSLYDAHHAIATILVHRGDHAGAAEAADRALQINPEDPRTLRVAYDAFRGIGDRERATEIAGRLATADPEFGAVGLLQQGGELFNSGDVAGAKPLLEQALELDPSLAKAYYLLGLCALNTGDYALAKQHLAKFLELDPNAADAPAARDMLAAIE
jgi:tetratricopeptide (TPR) repeat protein